MELLSRVAKQATGTDNASKKLSRAAVALNAGSGRSSPTLTDSLQALVDDLPGIMQDLPGLIDALPESDSRPRRDRSSVDDVTIELDPSSDGPDAGAGVPGGLGPALGEDVGKQEPRTRAKKASDMSSPRGDEQPPEKKSGTVKIWRTGTSYNELKRRARAPREAPLSGGSKSSDDGGTVVIRKGRKTTGPVEVAKKDVQKTGARMCSICGQYGHNKRTCPDS